MHPELTVKYLPLAALKPDPNNARTHPKRQVQQIADSITAFGFNNPIIVDEVGGVIAGPGRLTASPRFQIRQDEEEWTVFDNWTGLEVIIAGVQQSGLSRQDADELAELLQRRADKGDRRIYE